MNKFILPFLTFLFAFHSSAFVGVRAIQGADVDCLTESVPPILDRKNELNFRMIADVKTYGTNTSYPNYPDNIADIMYPSRRAVCDAYRTPNKLLPSYKKIMQHIDETYKEGNHRDFFFKYMLSMDCWAFSKNFFDHVSSGGDYSYYLGSMMKSTYGGVDPNAYIRITREGKSFEGPMFYVFEHLEKNYKNSKNAKEYSAVMRRLRSGERFNLVPVKSIREIKRSEPNMPINLN